IGSAGPSAGDPPAAWRRSRCWACSRWRSSAGSLLPTRPCRSVPVGGTLPPRADSGGGGALRAASEFAPDAVAIVKLDVHAAPVLASAYSVQVFVTSPAR